MQEIEESSYVFSFFALLAIVSIIALVALVLWQRKKLVRQTKLLKEKEEKIQWLRTISAQNDYRQVSKIEESEKRILHLEHEIQRLENLLKEGSKNQVMAKIEEAELKRSKVLTRIADMYSKGK